MKLFKNKKIIAAIIVSVLFVGEGCKKTFDINHDPNNPSLMWELQRLFFRCL